MSRRFFLNIDWGLIAPIFILIILSLTTLFSVNFSLFRSQLIFFIISFLAYLFFSNTNYKTARLYSIPIYIVSIILLLTVLIIGSQIRGSVRWLDLFGFRIQFSEVIKPFLVISFASFLASSENYSLKKLLLSVFFLSPIAFLIFIQPDLGNTLIYLLLAISTLIAFGFPMRFFLTGFVMAVLAFPVFWQFLHDYQKARILTFLNPEDPLGLSYNAIQSTIAVGSGMLSGKGLGLGTQSGLRFLPELHTDFIFATISEELGFIGAFIVILVFLFLLYKIFLILKRQEEAFCKVFAIMAFFLIFWQFFINVGMNIGILPVVGITLPFVSYGGSSLLSNFILIGILSAISKNSKSRDVLEIK